MPDDTKYEYRLDRASLLRAPVGATWDHEIYRPAKDTWDEYDWSGASESWMMANEVPPDKVDALMASLQELEASHKK